MPRQAVELYDLSRHPAYAARVGEIVALWSLIEMRLSILFAQLLRAPPWTTWTAWFALFNSKARQDMVRALSHALDATLPEKAEIMALVQRIAEAPNARRGYAHKPWLLVGNEIYQLDVPAMPLENSRKHHVALKTLEQERDALISLEADLTQFLIRFGNRYHLPIDPKLEGQQPWPGRFPSRNRGRRPSNAHTL
jgi:hypothetical protein